MKKKQKNKWLKAMSVALSCVLLATSAPAGALANETQTMESTEATIVEEGSCGENATYTLDSNGLLTISGEGAIGNMALEGSSNVKNIVIKEGITGIGDAAFSSCSSLTSVDIPNSVTTIGYAAFWDCSSLTSIVIPGSVTTIEEEAFYDCSSLINIVIPDGVTTIGDAAFSSCSSLTSIDIPNSVTTIGDYAFSGCSSLTSIDISSGITTIGYGAFGRCSSLTNITVSDANECYKDIDGVLYSKAEDEILCYPAGKSDTTYNIPNSVTTIGDDAFSGCSSLTSIDIPNSVTTIGMSAFLDCSSLTSIDIPDGVTTIGELAFQRCSSLTDIYYEGTEAQWNEIEIIAEIPNTATIHFESTGPDDSGNAPEDVPSDDPSTDDTEGDAPDDTITDDSYEVVLPADNTIITASDFQALLTENETRDVVITLDNGVSFTFAQGTMSAVDGMESYDFGATVVSDFADAGDMEASVTADNFVIRINYNYSGDLPAEASIKIYVGTDYANQTVYYSQILENGFEHMQSVLVDAEGYVTVTQDHCSDYVVTTNELGTADDTTPPSDTTQPSNTTPSSDNNTPSDTPTSPKTGEGTPLFAVLLTLVCGFALFGLKNKKIV